MPEGSVELAALLGEGALLRKAMVLNLSADLEG